MWFVFALITIFFWGGSDLFSKMGTNPRDPYSHWRIIIMVGLVMGLHATGFWLITGCEFSLQNLIDYLPVSFMYILSMVLGYAGLRYIELSVSSPICNSSGAVTALLCWLFLGQSMDAVQFAAVAMISVGLVLLAVLEKQANASAIKEDDKLKKYKTGFVAILFPLLYCVIDGLGSFMDAEKLEVMTEAQVNLSYEYTFLIVAVLAYLYLRFVRKQPFSLWKERTFGVGALCETIGQFTYVYALAEENMAIVAAPMISAYSIFSILLSRVFLKEKLNWKQYAVIALVMAGIVILGMSDI